MYARMPLYLHRPGRPAGWPRRTPPGLGTAMWGSEHLLLGLASQEYSAAARSLQSSGVDSRSLRSAISQLVGTGVPARSLHQGLTPKCCLAIQQAAAASRRLGQNAVSAEHLLLGLLQDRECAACRLMAEQGADLDQLSQGLAAFLGGEELPTAPSDPGNRSAAPIPALLDQCARDLTRMAADGQLDPVIGREEELTRVIQILSRRTKNNPRPHRGTRRGKDCHCGGAGPGHR